MYARVILVLTGIVCVSSARQINTGQWAVDKEPTNKINLEGMIFFHEKPVTDSNGENSKRRDVPNVKPNSLNAFAHFMPDQSKLSLAAGLSRAADNVKMVKQGSINNLYNYVPKDKLDTPFTSEVVGKNDQPQTKPQWMTNSFTGNDVMDNDKSQLIELSQLGIVKENVVDGIIAANDVKEFGYLNTGTGADFSNSNIFDNSLTENNFPSDTFRIGNAFGAEGTVDDRFTSDFNKNGYIFDDELSPPDVTSAANLLQSENRMLELELQTGNVEPIMSGFPSKIPLTSSNTADSLLNKNTSNQIDSGNPSASKSSSQDIVKPFPFGQIKGNAPPKRKRVPTLEIKSNFIDNSRKPILRVQSEFVDMSGRQNPKMETIGSFVDTSNSKLAQTTAGTTSKPITTIYTTTKAKFTTTKAPFATMSSPTTGTNSILTTPILQGRSSENTNQFKTSDLSNIEKQLIGLNSKGDKLNVVNPESEPGQNNLKVDMLYPPAPFPVIDQSNSIPNVTQTMQGDTNVDDVVMNNEQGQGSLNTDKQTNPMFDELDYDMYADDNAQNQQVSELSNSRKPIDLHYNDDHDRFITDPNVQVINPSNKIVPNDQTSNQNIIGSGSMSEEIGSEQNNFVNPANVGPINKNSQQVNNQGNDQNRQLNGQLDKNNLVQNNQINSNRQSNPSIQSSAVTSGTRTNNNFGSSSFSNNGNVMNQNRFNQNEQSGFQQNMNNFPSNRFNSVQNSVSNQNNQQAMFPGLNSGQNNFIGSNIPQPNQQNNIAQNRPLSTDTENMNDIQNGANTGLIPKNQINTFQNMASLNDGLITQNLNPNNVLNPNDEVNPNNVMNPNNVINLNNVVNPNNVINPNNVVNPNNVMNPNNVINPNNGINPQNNLINQNTISPNGQINSQNEFIQRNLNPNNNGISQNSLLNPNTNPNNAFNSVNNIVNPNLIPNNARNTPNNLNQNSAQNNAVNPNLNTNTVRNAQNNAVNQIPFSRVPGQSLPANIGTQPINTNMFPSQGQRFLGQGTAQSGNVDNFNFGNQGSNQNGQNGLNSQIRTNFNSINGNFGQSNFNQNNNIQNRPFMSSNDNTQVQTANNFQNNQNLRTTNGLASNVRPGQNLAQTLQNQNNFMNPNTFLGRQNNIPNFGNGFRQNSGNLLQTRQNIGTFPGSVTNVQRAFPGNMPQFQNNLPNNMLTGNIQNGVNNFGQFPSSNAFGNPGMNSFPSNRQFNSNLFRSNAINRQFGAFR
ncbi:GATA zinc finger domain-containing protein 14-like [Ruditapes philippinarum]|uniref:GATA zinc finger domain-containing protein 14-like n=1 Tax=Ruditapes philippinarum TaxID=129788 RepID=UPI00295AC41D|nr:GATA zinc finger domain-containing protein 14-like [Ruditapes philippinarum]